ncbi:sensor histidine kinase [Anaerocolumna sp. AGMB13020]|uniref:sensor histidine kinase n=1 Tax=Anaerocolumna sp. AGMB13020 TaxID=3081750 RepID=UPI0029531855|nr:sensor histidine kinase [Anaerocolumna sp. AGMB13020]WOO38745.1 sensor histidine kinase [Anaerocolumna sp. AGMB13020]
MVISLKLADYIKDKSIPLVLQILGAIAFSMFLGKERDSSDTALLLLSGWGFGVFFYYLIDYHIRKHYYNILFLSLDELDQKYLISDILLKPRRQEDILWQKVLRISNRAMLEEIARIRHESSNYTEYIEQWVHEVKTPISAIKLICENSPTEETRKIKQELERANRFVDQVLYFARSNNVEKDYLIREVSLEDVVKKALQNNKHLLLEKKVQINLSCDQSVFTDSKWIVFILDQCIVNSVKYGADSIAFKTEVKGSKTTLQITDNGVGIAREDLPRIFEKGFTGKNGHETEKSTGMGLYLCKKLCDKLDIGIEAESEKNNGTTIRMVFSTGRLMHAALYKQ